MGVLAALYSNAHKRKGSSLSQPGDFIYKTPEIQKAMNTRRTLAKLSAMAKREPTKGADKK